MCDAVRKYGNRRAAKAFKEVTAKCEQKRLQTIHSIVKNLMDSSHYTSEQAMNMIKLSPEDRTRVRQMIG